MIKSKGSEFMFNNDKTCFENTFSYPALSDLNMYYCGKRIKTPKHTYGPEIRKHFLILYVKEGIGTLLSCEKKTKLTSGNIFVMFPNEKIHYVVDKNSLWSISWIGIYGKQIYDFWRNIGISPDNPVFRPENPARVERIFEDIFNLSFSDAKCDKIRIIGLLYEFFSSVLKGNNMTRNDKNFIDEVINIVEYNYDKPLSIESIARNLFINPSYLSRIFKRDKGITLKEYILEKKILRAKELLTNKNISVKTISDSIGFSDPLYFSRIFKKKTGLSPSKYREFVF